MQCDWCPYKTRRLAQIDTHTEESPCEDHEKTAICNQGVRPRKKPNLLIPWSQTSTLQNWGNTFLLFKPPSLQYFAMTAQANTGFKVNMTWPLSNDKNMPWVLLEGQGRGCNPACENQRFLEIVTLYVWDVQKRTQSADLSRVSYFLHNCLC